MAEAIEQYLSYEAALVVAAGTPGSDAPVPPVADDARQMVEARYSLKVDDRLSNEVAGLAFDSVRTTVDVMSSERTGDRTVATVVESTTYGFAESDEEYAYAARHLVTVVEGPGGWVVADVVTPDPMSNLTPDRVLEAMNVDPTERRVAASVRVSEARAALERNADGLADTAFAKLNAFVAEVTSDPEQTLDPVHTVVDDALATTPPPGSLPQPSLIARPDVKELPEFDGAMDAVFLGPGSGPPYNYRAMVDYALKYAVAPPAVTYTRDDNDCTTFISWALYNGGWKEEGAQNYPSVSWNRDNDNVWYWRCNDCSPRHSYTWGGAANFLRFAHYHRDVPILPYITDIVPSDVLQLEIDGYGSTKWPDHTMMATGFASGWDLLSYHTDDTRNKPLNIILSQHDGPYWALRT